MQYYRDEYPFAPPLIGILRLEHRRTQQLRIEAFYNHRLTAIEFEGEFSCYVGVQIYTGNAASRCLNVIA